MIMAYMYNITKLQTIFEHIQYYYFVISGLIARYNYNIVHPLVEQESKSPFRHTSRHVLAAGRSTRR